MLNCCIEKKHNREMHQNTVGIMDAGISEEEEEDAMETEEQEVTEKEQVKDEKTEGICVLRFFVALTL
jgi:hypothetical protein